MSVSIVKSIRAKEFERKTARSFAGLIEVPGTMLVRGKPLYWSQSRVYGAAIQQWLSVDPLLKWDPKTLLDKPGNWRAVRYAGNRPLELVDTNGQWVGIALGAIAVAGWIHEEVATSVRTDDAITPVSSPVDLAAAGIGSGLARSSVTADPGVADEATAASRFRTQPIDLQEKLAMDEAKAGAGKRIPSKKLELRDDKYQNGRLQKYSHNHDHFDGTKTEIHYDRDFITGERSGFKFKDGIENIKSRANKAQ